MKKISKVFLQIMAMSYLLFYTALVIARNKDKKMRRLYDNIILMQRLLEMKDGNLSVAEKLGVEKGKTIAIYGNGIIGKQITKQLMLEGIQVNYAVDKLSNVLRYEGIPVYRPDLKLPQVDIMIVTPVGEYSDIKRKLENKMTCRIVSIRDLLG